ncbi:hypothetical protein NDO71_orf189 [Klebsiella phage vB_KpnM_NDO71]|nr:hypothetical protein NDO71_orf189 [Klebsiella phage vB_KpnM_NDO71]
MIIFAFRHRFDFRRWYAGRINPAPLALIVNGDDLASQLIIIAFYYIIITLF